MALKGAPLILLSPSKTLNFDSPLSSALVSAGVTENAYLPQASRLVGVLAKHSRAQIKQLMGLSDSLAELNHGRFVEFDAQPARVALGAFEGAAYKGLDAPTLSADAIEYLQGSLRILCGLYGIVRPLDEIRPYRLEMSTRLVVDAATPNLYRFWGDSLTMSLAAELRDAPHKPSFVLNVASQEYAKAVDLKPGGRLGAPIVTAVFPGPAVHAKTARGAMARFCAQQRVCSPAQLKLFRGNAGEWSFVESASTDTSFVFHRSASGGAPAEPKAKAQPKPKAAPKPKAEPKAKAAPKAAPKPKVVPKAKAAAEPATKKAPARKSEAAEAEEGQQGGGQKRPRRAAAAHPK